MDDLSADGPMSRRRPRGDAAARRWALARNWALCLALTLVSQSALAQAMYRMKLVGTLGVDVCAGSYANKVEGMNNSNQVVMTACNSNGDVHAFLWNNDGTAMMDLGPNEVGAVSQATGINASGQVAGWGEDSTGYFAFRTEPGGTPMTRINDILGGNGDIAAYALNDLGQITGEAGVPYDITKDIITDLYIWNDDGSPYVDLGNMYGEERTAGLSINNSGQIAGAGYFEQVATAGNFVFLNNGSPPITLANGPSGLQLGSGPVYSAGVFINASGQVSGTGYFANNRYKAYLWKNDGTAIQSLGTLGGSESASTGLNDAGQVIGWSYTYRFLKPHAFIWLNNGSPMKDLGTFGGTTSQANNINASGQVTGYANLAGDTTAHAFLWRNDGTTIQDINALIDPTDPSKPYVTLTNGDFINGLGDIVADGTDSRTGLQNVYLLQGTVLTLNPRSLAFGNQAIKTTSAAKSVTMTNTGPKAAAITTIALTGTPAGQFTQTNNCGKSLAGHKTCTIKVTFKPTTTGAKSGTLNVNGGGGGLRAVKITGNAT
jgi:probable HAF family extracellular repeat protein